MSRILTQSKPTTLPKPPASKALEVLSPHEPPIVQVVQHGYRVEWEKSAPGFGGPRFHHVNKNKQCDCTLGKNCPSVEAVAEYLAKGGERAPDYPVDFWPSVPEQCPICCNPCVARPSFNFKGHGIGWACTSGGILHYWEARIIPIKQAIQSRKGQPRWVIPPTYDERGNVLHPGVTLADMETTWVKARAVCHSTYSPQETTHMKNHRIIRVPSLAAFVKEVPPINGKAAVVRLAAAEAFLPQRGKSAMPRKNIGLSLQGVNEHGEVTWMHESHVVLWLPDGPGFGADRAIYNGVMDLKDVVRDHLASLGYDVRDGDYALPSNLQPLNTRFECAKWVKVSEQEWKVEPVKGD